jgi:very-short-patch-repair endonuclease
MFKHPKPEAIARARVLRGTATAHERKLWRKLRELNRNGYHFRRQVPFRGYTLDFVEHAAHLVIELDGVQHGLQEQRERDTTRDAVIGREGYRILRFWNREVNDSFDVIVDAIVRELERRWPPPETLRVSTSPQGGG